LFHSFLGRRGNRQPYTTQQLIDLEQEFQTSFYITTARRWELARYLDLTPKQVKIWFNNRRTKQKKEMPLDLHQCVKVEY
jgi:hypothetical protein